MEINVDAAAFHSIVPTLIVIGVIGLLIVVLLLWFSAIDIHTAGFGLLATVATIVAVATLPGGGFEFKSGRQKWEEFSKQHNCKTIAKRDGHSDVGIGMTMRGQIGMVFGGGQPDQTAYKCDDGVIYWKNY